MKKESNEKRILRYLLEQQFPDTVVVAVDATTTNTSVGGGTSSVGPFLKGSDGRSIRAVDHVTQIALEGCRCIHLQEHLPHLLNLELCGATQNLHPRGWVVANPIHSLHLSSQMDDTISAGPQDPTLPIFYGEEQQRTTTLNTEGIPEYWCPLNGYSTTAIPDHGVGESRHLSTTIHSESSTTTTVTASTAGAGDTLNRIVPPKASLVSSMIDDAERVVGSTPALTSDTTPSAPIAAATTTHSNAMPLITPSKSDDNDTTLPNEVVPSTGSSDGLVKQETQPHDDPSAPTTNPNNQKQAKEEEQRTDAETEAQAISMEIDKEESNQGEIPVGKAEDDIKNRSTKLEDISTTPPEDDMGKTTRSIHSEEAGPTIRVKSSKDEMEVEEPLASDAKPIDKDGNTIQPASVTSSTDAVVNSILPPVISSSSMASTTPEMIPLELPEAKYNHLKMEEDRIRLIRRHLSSSRMLPKKKVDPKDRVDPKKKRKRDDQFKIPTIPGWQASNRKPLTKDQENQWLQALETSKIKVERWMETFRSCRETFWDERQRQLSQSAINKGSFYLPQDHLTPKSLRCCEICVSGTQVNGTSPEARKPKRRCTGDDVMQCLDCSFMGCSPQSMCRDSKQHISQHLLITGHKFAVSCGERCQLFCFGCGDVVYHEVFEQERARIDYGKKVPSMAWKPHQLYRSFDPFHFMKTQDHGIVWRGLVATYPQLVPQEHIRATEATCRRQALFNGEVEAKWLTNTPVALTFAAMQSLMVNSDKHVIKSPVGMYNLGNTCYKSSVLQCLVHCPPLQQFFLKDNGHHHHACKLYRQWDLAGRKKKHLPEESICLACEMDRLYLAYYGHTIGMDVKGAVEDVCNMDSLCPDGQPPEKGDPLVISEMLTASWKSGGMNSVASYKQHDSHEFLNSFLELVGKQSKQHWGRVHAAINAVKTNNAVLGNSHESKHGKDIVKTLFEGSLSSVLLCEECGTKRKRSEEFLNVSLSLSEEVARRQSDAGSTKSCDLSVETCLERFVTAEKLGDSVDCPSCARKTTTQKQHTFGTLPKVLCLHLKRFDAAQNKKIDDYVSFPARGLNMGRYLAQWCEVSSLSPCKDEFHGAEPQINYDLFGTVNHVGNMSSGHYVTNVNVGSKWYRFNDAHVTLAGGDGGVDTVVKNAGAYILFYVRR